MLPKPTIYPKDEDRRFRELDLQKQGTTAFLKEYRENLRIFIESITGYPATITLEQSGHRAEFDLTRDTQIVELPAKISIFPELERNRETLVLLAGIRAASYRYTTGRDDQKLKPLLKKAHTQGLKQFKKNDNPVTYPSGTADVYLHSPFSGHNDFFSHFRGCREIESIFSSIELGRVMSCLYRDYPPIFEWYRDILPHFYLYTHVPLAAGFPLDGGSDAQRNERGNQHENEPWKEGLLRSILLRLPFTLILQDQQFDMHDLEAVGKKATRLSIIRARHRGIDIEKQAPGRLEQLVHEADCVFELAQSLRTETIHKLIPLYEQSKLVLEEGTSLEASLEASIQVYFLLYELMRAGTVSSENSEGSAYTNVEHPSISSVLHTIEMACSPDSIKSKYTLRDKDPEKAYQQRRFAELEGVPSYPEWDETIQQRLPRHVHIKEMVWNEERQRFKDKHKEFSPKLTQSYPTTAKTRRQTVEPSSKDFVEFAVKQPPFPPSDEEVVRRITAQLMLLKPEEYARIARLRRGTLDTREHTRYHAKVRAGVPVRPNFFYDIEKHERSVASLVLLDVSDSTGELLNSQYTFLDMMKQGCLSFVQGLTNNDDPVAVYAVTSCPTAYQSRLWTTFYQLKDFDDDSGELERKLGRVAPLHNNRDGAIIRHGTQLLVQRPEKIRLLVYISDGEPHDRQIPKDPNHPFYNPKYEGNYAWGDVCAALREARAREVTPLIIRVHDTETKNLEQIAGLGAFFRTVKTDMTNLVAVLADAYMHLTK